METKHVVSLEDMVFAGRNKDYGAYVLRKNYKKHVTAALVISMVLLAGAVAYPLISSYMSKGRSVSEAVSVETEIYSTSKEEVPPPPPPPPPPAAQMAEKLRFVVPKVVDDTLETTLATQDELSTKPNVEVPVINEEIKVEDKNDQVIEIPAPKKEIFTVVEEQPSFPGGEEARMKFFLENMKYPEEAMETGIQGTVFLTFVVEDDGSITDVKILRGIGGGCDAEAIRVVQAMPKWIPGKQRGIPVRVQFNLPIKFTLQ